MKASQASQGTIRDFKAALAELEKAGFPRSQDLVMIRPLSYEDETHVTPITQAVPGMPFLAEVSCLKQRTAGSWNRRILECLVEDDSAEMVIRFMSFMPGMKKALAPGNHVRLFGQFSGDGGDLFGKRKVMMHPRIRPANRELPGHLTARYPKVAKVAEGTLAQLVRKELMVMTKLRDTVPPALRKQSRTIRMGESLRILHKPRRYELDLVASRAVPSLKHDEWMAHILFRRVQNSKLKKRKAPAMASTASDIDVFERHLPFTLTRSQRVAMTEVAKDLGKNEAMRRLIHGDVGCGKTLVAAFACWLSARQGNLAAIMCPTVILASQHHRRLVPLFKKLGIECVLLVGSVRGKARNIALQAIADGGKTIVIGTHALVQDKTEMPTLSFAVIDEQHRFGVNQRKALEKKGPGAHVLMMSATPIPRTLELGLLSHLDITRITERPNRGDVRTLVFSADRVDEVLREIVSSNLQAYWICPLIRQSAKLNLRAAEDEYQRIRNLAPQLDAAMIHGKMDTGAKLDAMKDFEAGKTRLLVATTVVEVGVDAPEADVIVIDHAERLGLSQLHQLRGRVGRGDKTGFCALVYEPGLSKTAIERLKIVREHSDGFLIAREDLRQRGPGDIIGKRQHGMPKYWFADLEDDPSLLETAKDGALRMLNEHPQQAYEHIHLWMGGGSRVTSAAEVQSSRQSA